MSDFNYTEYLRDNPLLKVDPDTTLITERKKEGYDDREDESVSARKGKEADKKQSFKDRRDDSYGKMGKRDAEKKGKNKINKEGMSRYEEDDIKTEEISSSKLKVSELKAKIRETILSELSEESQYNASIYSEAEEDVDVDVDLGDIEDEVNVDVEPDEIDIEKQAVNTTVQVGLSPEEEVIQDSLKAAMDSANALGNDKLADQIGNTITFFTREYVVGRNSD
tara:strand:+ start:1091 stop:1759 length:669 start_codon:yes stop_codon:yes gene_type:complete